MNYVKRSQTKRCAARWWKAGWGVILSAAALSGQTRLDLPTQSKRVDFTQAQATAPVKAGTAPPETCNVGELFYDTDGTPGQNLYGCTALNTWTLQAGSGGGGGASAFNQLTDLKVTLSSNTYTVAAGNAAVGDTTTVFTVATLTETDPDDSGTIYFCLDSNNGNPRLLAVIPVAFTESNYATSGITLLDGAGCPNDSRTLATAAMVNGTPANPIDFRGAIELAPTVIAGTGLLKVNGNSGRSRTLSIDTTRVVQKFMGAGTPAGTITGSTLGDLYVDTSARKAYMCTNTAGNCTGVAAGQWVILN